ncbi:hypothetical protein [Thalassotalea sp. G2M2-11]|uniref:hypothetical protein n=1 Tax=Thalassotalea sp. G2M2-11 TaxID=2787627 RepID=UPI0019D25072|nr:hypothetical protein [Thalassotalea sp. G2M2-11]
MSAVHFDRDASIKNGWRQGSLFNSESSPLLYNLLPQQHKIKNAIYMVLSHPCSLLNANLDSEPDLEYIVCKQIEKLDGNATFGKNPRLLHINIQGHLLELQQKYRGFIQKSPISNELPMIASLDFNDESLITRWMANRYITTALPDMFEFRLNKAKAKSKLTKAFNSEIGKYCKSVYISLNEFIKDLSDDESYECSLVFVLSRDSYAKYVEEEDNEQSSYSDFLKRISDIIDPVVGINLNRAMFVGEHRLTIEQVESGKLKKWQFDYVSIGKEGEVGSPVI